MLSTQPEVRETGDLNNVLATEEFKPKKTKNKGKRKQILQQHGPFEKFCRTTTKEHLQFSLSKDETFMKEKYLEEDKNFKHYQHLDSIS